MSVFFKMVVYKMYVYCVIILIVFVYVWNWLKGGKGM